MSVQGKEVDDVAEAHHILDPLLEAGPASGCWLKSFPVAHAVTSVLAIAVLRSGGARVSPELCNENRERKQRTPAA